MKDFVMGFVLGAMAALAIIGMIAITNEVFI